MDIVTLDFETYYDRDFSLKKMTTEAYIRNPMFQVIGVGVKINDHPTDWYSGNNVKQFLSSLDFSKCAMVCHNAAFDGAILNWHYNIKPKFWFDTLSMARPLHSVTVGGSLAALATYYGLGKKGDEVINAEGKRREDFTEQELARYAGYCINDVELTYKLFKKLKKDFPVSELMVIDQTIRMFTEPCLRLDTKLLAEYVDDIEQKKLDFLQSISGDIEGAKSVLMSNDKFAQLLKSIGVEPPTKTSARTGKTTWAFAKTDKGMTDLLEHDDHRVRMLAAARLGTKSTIEQTRAAAFVGIGERGTLPIMLNYYGAHTGRFSGGDKVNLQNLPARGNNKIRQAILAPNEYSKIIACDSSQIEARLVAWLAGQDDLVQAFREGRDVYSEFATEVYGRKITKTDKVERFVGKTCILGLGYGMGAEKFRRTLEIGQGGINVVIDIYEAERIVRLYRQKNWKIVELWQRCGYALQGILTGSDGVVAKCVSYNRDGIVLPNNLKIVYPALRASNNGFEYVSDARAYRTYIQTKVNGDTPKGIKWTKIYGGKVTENIVQALAAIVIREQMAKIGQQYKVAFQVHDEIVITAGAASADHAEKELIRVMSKPPSWAADLPVACEAGQASNYGDV